MSNGGEALFDVTLSGIDWVVAGDASTAHAYKSTFDRGRETHKRGATHTDTQRETGGDASTSGAYSGGGIMVC